MKILMLGWELPPFNSGGLGVACYHLCRRLADLGVDIDFVMPFDLPAEHTIDFMRVHGVTHTTAPGQINAYADWSAAHEAQQLAYHQKIVALVRARPYDAIHAHDWLTFKAGMLAKQLTGKPLVAHVHSTEFDRAGAGQGNPIVHDIERNGLLMADRIIAVSGATKTILIDKYNIPTECIDVVHNSALPSDMLQADPTNAYHYLERMKSHGYKIVVSIARLTIQKGLTHLLHAAQKAIQLDPKLLFLIVGDGDQRDELIALSAELGIADHIIFTGFLRGKQWRDAYHIGDMFVMSSVSEPFGLTALEAASTDNAVLLTKQSGVSEVLLSAITYDFWDTNKLADSIVNIAAQDVLRDCLAKDAKNEVAGMSWHKAANHLVGTYQTLGALA
ncbi:MAG TPA: glycosyltransferase family 4 protein [Magnetospirillaceae bacterium]|nr:glycosyltransferase family 4 protein [Magnetospirillaceae bacterium]